MKQKIFVDTNIALDMLMMRVPFHKVAKRLFKLSEEKTFGLYISTVSFTSIHYFLSKKTGKRMASNILKDFKKMITLLPVNETMINRALYSNFDDFEDAVQYQCSVASGMHVLVTRNTKDFGEAKITVRTAEAFLRNL